MMGGETWHPGHRWMFFEGNRNPLSLELNGSLRMSKLIAGFLSLFHYLLNLFMPCDCHCVPLPCVMMSTFELHITF